MATVVLPPAPVSRRALWVPAFWGTLTGGSALAALAGLTYLVPRRTLGVGDAGAAADYAPGDVRFLPGAPAAPRRLWWGAFVVRRPDGFVAFPALCAHRVAQPCVLAWRPDQPARGLACFCHGGGWHPATGDPIEAPPDGAGGAGGGGFVPHVVPAWPLPSLPVGLVAGRVRVGLSGAKERVPGQPPLVTPVR